MLEKNPYDSMNAADFSRTYSNEVKGKKVKFTLRPKQSITHIISKA